MGNKFEPVEFIYGKKESVDLLKKAMETTESTTMIRNESIKFNQNGFTITQPTDEHFLFNFAWQYGKLTATKNDILLKKVTEQETVLLKTRENLERRNIKLSDNKTWNYERAKFIGMLDMLDVMGIDRKQFNWIF